MSGLPSMAPNPLCLLRLCEMQPFLPDTLFLKPSDNDNDNESTTPMPASPCPMPASPCPMPASPLVNPLGLRPCPLLLHYTSALK